MPRLMHGDEGGLFRAVVTTFTKHTHSDDIGEYTQHLGPFGDARQARAAITRTATDAARQLQRARWHSNRGGRPYLDDVLVEGTVQRTDIRWEAV